MPDALTDFEKQLIYTAFYKHHNMSPKEMEAVVGADPVPETPPVAPTGPGEAPAASAVEPPAPAPVEAPPETPGTEDDADEAAIEEPELLTEEQALGRRLIRVKRKKKEEIDEADYLAMRGAVNYIRRHSDRPPKNEEKLPEWRYNLMARGFDPEKERAQNEQNQPHAQ